MYRVTHGFEDLKTNIFHDIGTEISADEPRLKEFIDAGVVEGIVEGNRNLENTEGIEVEPRIPEEDFEKMTVKEIKEKLLEKEIKFNEKSTKKELIELLEGAN